MVTGIQYLRKKGGCKDQMSCLMLLQQLGLVHVSMQEMSLKALNKIMQMVLDAEEDLILLPSFLVSSF